jgi:AcrR family transcriptional regulator
MTKTTVRTRSAEATKARIMAAAKSEFARLGFAGARVDDIAEQAQANKRMIYHYFGSKESLFQSVLEEAYLDIRNAEQELNLDDHPPQEALECLVRFTWQYYLDNPEFITLVNSANLHRAKHIIGSKKLPAANQRLNGLVQAILDRGVKEGVFRSGVDALQLNITIAAVGYYYLTNRYTGEVLFDRDYMNQNALDGRLAFNLDTILRLVRV